MNVTRQGASWVWSSNRLLSLALFLALLSVFSIAGIAKASEQKLLASDGVFEDYFGYGVEISGNYAIVGAPNHDDPNFGVDSGAAYIYHYNGTSWVEQQKLLPSDGATGKLFGCSVSISGDYAIVGAYGDTQMGASAGAAYVFYYDGTNWLQQNKLTASDGAANADFGFAVSISGGNAIVGAYGAAAYKGAAYIFNFNGTTWSQKYKAVTTDALAAGDNFGIDVSISGNYAIVGCSQDDLAGAQYPYTDAGAAYIFRYNGTSWAQQVKLVSPVLDAGDLFGTAVRISGTKAMVGAPGDVNGILPKGSAYIYNYNGSSWVLQSQLIPPNDVAYDSFGYSVAISDTNAVAGSLGDPQYSNGYAFVYDLAGSSWVEQQILSASDGAADSVFGAAVGISGNFVVVGAILGGDNGDHSGAAYVYRGVAPIQTLKVSKIGTGTGTVASTVPDALLSCGLTCTGTYSRTTAVSLTATADPGHTFTGWSGCDTTNGNTCDVVMNDERNVVASFAAPVPVVVDKIGAYDQGNWYLDASGNGTWEPGADLYGYFGAAGMTPLVGDWNGTGHAKIAVYANGVWYFDLNGNGLWDGEPTDRTINTWGDPTDIPVTGDWNGDGVAEIGIYRPSNFTWYLDYDGNFLYDPAVDIAQAFGFAACIPVVGDWSGDGRDKIGVYYEGQWYLDINGNFGWDGYEVDKYVPSFGVADMLPVVGDWTGSGLDRIGAYRDGNWYLDLDGDGSWSQASDRQMGPFGVSGMLPMVGKW